MIRTPLVIAPLALLASAAVLQAGDQPWSAFSQAPGQEVARQVRIEQRVIIRITPRAPSGAQPASVQTQPQPKQVRFEERKAGKCLNISEIAAVQDGPNNKLVLYMRDRRIMSAALDKACSARDFYSGFYVERNSDGQLCINRDNLHARNGASCQLSKINQLVAVED